MSLYQMYSLPTYHLGFTAHYTPEYNGLVQSTKLLLSTDHGKGEKRQKRALLGVSHKRAGKRHPIETMK